MLNQRDAYTTHFLSAATEMILGQLEEAGRGTLKNAFISRRDDRDVFTAEFTLTKRPDIVFVLERTAYSPELEARLSAGAAVSVLMGTIAELVHLPTGEATNGVITV